MKPLAYPKLFFYQPEAKKKKKRRKAMLKLGLNYMPCFTPKETRSFCLGGCFSPFCMLKANKQANKTMHFNYIFTQNIILGLQFKIPICISKHIPKNSNTPNPKLTIRSCLPPHLTPLTAGSADSRPN